MARHISVQFIRVQILDLVLVYIDFRVHTHTYSVRKRVFAFRKALMLPIIF